MFTRVFLSLLSFLIISSEATLVKSGSELKSAISSASGSYELTIIEIGGTFTLDEAITTTAGQNIEIIGNGYTLNVTSSLHFFTVKASSELTVSNWKFTGTYSPFFVDGNFTAVLSEFYSIICEDCQGSALNIDNNGATATFENCTFSNNIGYTGGLIYAGYGTTVLVTNSVFSHNNASYGGCVYSYGSAFTVIDTIFSHNSVDNFGGVFNSMYYATLDISGSTFEYNLAFEGGSIYSYQFSSLTITETTFSNNAALTLGGAIYFDSNENLVLGNVDFVSNAQTESGKSHGGGALYNDGGSVYVYGSTFTSNTAYKGGAIYQDSGYLIIYEPKTFTDNVASSNSLYDDFYIASTSTYDDSDFVECYYGFYYKGSECKPCSAGYYGTLFSLTTSSCSAKCSAGTYSVAGSSACTSCPGGYYGAAAGLKTSSCTASCSGGTYATTGASTCTTCGYGVYSLSASSECANCDAGYYGANFGLSTSSCSGYCKAGYYSNAGFSVCLGCPKGTYNTLTASTACIDCPSGQDSDGHATSCSKNKKSNTGATVAAVLCSLIFVIACGGYYYYRKRKAMDAMGIKQKEVLSNDVQTVPKKSDPTLKQNLLNQQQDGYVV